MDTMAFHKGEIHAQKRWVTTNIWNEVRKPVRKVKKSHNVTFSSRGEIFFNPFNLLVQ